MGAPRRDRVCEECGAGFRAHQCQINRGGGRFCSTGCGVSWRNKRDNPSKRPEARAKISRNHADVSGRKNPMFGRRGILAPGWIDGRRLNDDGSKNTRDEPYRALALKRKPRVCEYCGVAPSELRRLNVHHKDRNRANNNIENLEVLCVECHHNVAHADRRRDSLGRYA